MTRRTSKSHKLKRRLRIAHHEHQGGKCAYCSIDMDIELHKPCGKQKGHGLTLEHILPQIYGGKNTLEETVGICATFSHAYSDLTGYLWTNEAIDVGGHDLLKEINEMRKGIKGPAYIAMRVEKK